MDLSVLDISVWTVVPRHSVNCINCAI